MNSTSPEIRGLNITSFFNRRGLWRCYRCCLSSFFAIWAASVCLHCWGLFVVCHLSKHFSAVHSIVIVWAGYIRLLFKLPLKFRNVLQYTKSRSSFLVIKISKKTSPQSWRFYFALKRNETKHKLILHENIHATRWRLRQTANGKNETFAFCLQLSVQ